MTALTDEQYKQITESAGWNWDYMSDIERDMMRAVAEAAIAADRAARAEPVGWAYWHQADPKDSFRLTTLRWATVDDDWREAAVYTTPPAAPVVQDDTIDAVGKALRRAWQLGQTYWQQADHEFASYHRKADETQAKFDALVDETRALFAACRACRGGVEAEPAAKAIHYPTCWDTAAYPTIGDALAAVYHHFKCSECAPPAVPAEWREVMRAIADFEPIVMTSSSYGGSVFRVELGFRNLVDRNKGHDFLLKLIHFRDLLAGTKQSGGWV